MSELESRLQPEDHELELRVFDAIRELVLGVPSWSWSQRRLAGIKPMPKYQLSPGSPLERTQEITRRNLLVYDEVMTSPWFANEIEGGILLNHYFPYPYTRDYEGELEETGKLIRTKYNAIGDTVLMEKVFFRLGEEPYNFQAFLIIDPAMIERVTREGNEQRDLSTSV